MSFFTSTFLNDRASSSVWGQRAGSSWEMPVLLILLCGAYEIDGRRVGRWPASGAELARAKPVYERFPGWEEPLHDIRTMAGLPEPARRYVSALEEVAGAPIVLLSVGPERTQTIERAWRPMRRHRSAPRAASRGADAR